MGQLNGQNNKAYHKPRFAKPKPAHPRRSAAHRRQRRQAAGAAEQATDLYRPTSAMTSTSDISLHCADSTSWATSGSRLLSFEDLIGGREELIRNGEAERLSGF